MVFGNACLDFLHHIRYEADIADLNGWTTLIEAAPGVRYKYLPRYDSAEDYARILIRHGANVNYRNKYEATPWRKAMRMKPEAFYSG